MSRLSNAIAAADKGYAIHQTKPILDLSYGGQQGWSPNLVEWISNQAYVRRNLVCIVLEVPKFFDLMDNPEIWRSSLKALMELHSKTIDGLKAGLTVQVAEHNVGGAGEKQHEFTNVTRDQSEPVHTVVEKYGNPIQTLLYYWITYGMMDPDTKTSMLGTLQGNGRIPSDLLADWYTMSCLYFEPDPLHRRVIRSWVCTNMFPKGTGEIVGKRDLTADAELLELSLEFTAISQHNLGTNLFAQAILDRINIDNANPYFRPSFSLGRETDTANANGGYDLSAEFLGNRQAPYAMNDMLPASGEDMIMSPINSAETSVAMQNSRNIARPTTTGPVMSPSSNIIPKGGAAQGSLQTTTGSQVQ